MGVHRDALPLNSVIGVLQPDFHHHQRPPGCQTQWTLSDLLSHVAHALFAHCLSSFPCFGFSSITFGFYLFAFGRLSSILVKSPQSHGLCSIPALLLVCLPVTWVTCQILLSQRVSSYVKWGFTERTPWSSELIAALTDIICSSDCRWLSPVLWLFFPFH